VLDDSCWSWRVLGDFDERAEAVEALGIGASETGWKERTQASMCRRCSEDGSADASAMGDGGWLRATRHEPGNGALRDFEAELEQLAVNGWRAPKRIRECHGTHEIRKLGADPWSTDPPAA
jgi:hypothetical protein